MSIGRGRVRESGRKLGRRERKRRGHLCPKGTPRALQPFCGVQGRGLWHKVRPALLPKVEADSKRACKSALPFPLPCSLPLSDHLKSPRLSEENTYPRLQKSSHPGAGELRGQAHQGVHRRELQKMGGGGGRRLASPGRSPGYLSSPCPPL